MSQQELNVVEVEVPACEVQIPDAEVQSASRQPVESPNPSTDLGLLCQLVEQQRNLLGALVQQQQQQQQYQQQQQRQQQVLTEKLLELVARPTTSDSVGAVVDDVQRPHPSPNCPISAPTTGPTSPGTGDGYVPVVVQNVPRAIAISGTSDADWKRVALTLAARSPCPTERPFFRGTDDLNPVFFLERFERYWRKIAGSGSDKLSAVVDSLQKYPAWWASLRESSWHTYEDFKVDFLAQFWSPTKQHQVRSQILARTFPSSHRSSMSEFFVMQVNEFRTLTECPSETVLVAYVMQQFPENVQSLWTVYPDRSFTGALEFLERQSAHPAKRPRPQPPVGRPSDRFHYYSSNPPPPKVNVISVTDIPRQVSSTASTPKACVCECAENSGNDSGVH